MLQFLNENSAEPHDGRHAAKPGDDIAWNDAPLDYAIVNLTYDNWIYRHTTDDIALPLYYSLRRMGYRVEIFTNTLSSRGVNIIFGLQDRPDFELSSIPGNSILYNFEQIKPDSKGARPHYIEALRRFQVWEYSLPNLKILRRVFGLTNIIYFPFGYCPEMTRLAPDYPADIDVLLYGSLNERRMKIIHELQAAGVKALAVAKAFGLERDFLIARSKVILNVHYYVPGIQEIVRLGYLWANHKPVVCERNADTTIHPSYEQACIYAPYDELVQKTLDCLLAPKAMKMQADLGFKAFSANDYRHILSERAQILLKKRRATAEEMVECDRRPQAFYKDAIGEWIVGN